METVEVLIKIPKELYQMIKEDTLLPKNLCISEAIQNGIVLPKGHGDLKDMGILKYVFDLTREDNIYSGKDIERAIKAMKSIIEADKGAENEDSD